MAGVGPGPYNSSDNYIEGSGNLWHYDNGGGTWDPGRHDYTHYRDYWRFNPRNCFMTNSAGNGPGPFQWTDHNIYGHRHFLEWKDGNRISIVGNIFNGGCVDATGTNEAVEISAKDGVTTSDVLFSSDSFFHMPGGILMGVQEATGGGPAFEPLPAARHTYRNLLFYDINPTRHTNNGYALNHEAGWIFDGEGAEDTVIDHVTALQTTTSAAGVPVFIYLPDQPAEGDMITNNFIRTEPPNGNGGQYGFAWYDTGANLGDSCHGLTNGEPLLVCKLGTNLKFWNNALNSTSATVAQMQAAFPDYVSTNFFQAGPPNSLGFFNANGWNFTEGGVTKQVPNFRMKALFQSGAPLVPGNSGPAADLNDVGAEVDKVEADQGNVIFVSANATGVGTASVTLDQPDTGTCTLDYGTGPTVTTFTRASQACTPGPVTFNLTGLTTHTLYYFRYDGAVSQPYGHFMSR